MTRFELLARSLTVLERILDQMEYEDEEDGEGPDEEAEDEPEPVGELRLVACHGA